MWSLCLASLAHCILIADVGASFLPMGKGQHSIYSSMDWAYMFYILISPNKCLWYTDMPTPGLRHPTICDPLSAGK